jgi:hypothetical protein
MSEGCWELNKPLELNKISNNSLSVLSVFSVFSVVNHAGIGIFENPQDRGKIHTVLGQVGRFFGRVEFQLHVPNVCRINSHVKPSLGGLSLGNANVPVGFARHVSRAEEDLSVPEKGAAARHYGRRVLCVARASPSRKSACYPLRAIGDVLPSHFPVLRLAWLKNTTSTLSVRCRALHAPQRKQLGGFP